jgi:hypothetical protein
MRETMPKRSATLAPVSTTSIVSGVDCESVKTDAPDAIRNVREYRPPSILSTPTIARAA